MQGVLSGIRVLDLSRILAGPWAGQLLADLGAEVIKIERPGAGDDTRSWGPPFVAEGEAAYYHGCNRGKRSVAIDIARPEGQALVQRLAGRCDILLENFKVGTLERYSLGYAQLQAHHPALIYCSITGFGQSGPYRERAGYDLLIQALGGMMSVTGQPDGSPGGEPMKVGVAIADVFTGMYAGVAVLGALRHRDRTGEGQHIDLSLLDVQVATLANQAMNYLVAGKVPQRLGNAHPNIVPYQAFAAADGHLVLAVGNDEQFRRFCEAAGEPALAADPRYARNRDRVANRDELLVRVAALIQARPRAFWLEALEARGVPCGPINDLSEVFADPQVQARGLAQTFHRADGEAVPGVANPIRYSRTPIAAEQAAPRLGEHTHETLQGLLDMPEAEIAALAESGTVQLGKP
jgi:crotonobetainyl-CoA:carnitine CoA-transferase CaiB-like acyl-CoA transferase